MDPHRLAELRSIALPARANREERLRVLEEPAEHVVAFMREETVRESA